LSGHGFHRGKDGPALCLRGKSGFAIFAASAEDVVIAKLEWAKRAQSRRHIEDVAGILRMRWDSLDHAYLERWIVELGLPTEWKDARHATGL
jgi:hypothetical protein